MLLLPPLLLHGSRCRYFCGCGCSVCVKERPKISFSVPGFALEGASLLPLRKQQWFSQAGGKSLLLLCSSSLFVFFSSAAPTGKRYMSSLSIRFEFGSLLLFLPYTYNGFSFTELLEFWGRSSRCDLVWLRALCSPLINARQQ